MQIADALRGVRQLYIETSPIIYYVETHRVYVERMESVIAVIEERPIYPCTSVITLTEVLKQPIALQRHDLVLEYRTILSERTGFQILQVTRTIAEQAAYLRAQYGLRTPDALHVASAIANQCDAFLTNDLGIKRVKEIPILILDELS